MSNSSTPALRKLLDSSTSRDLSMEELAQNAQPTDWVHFLLENESAHVSILDLDGEGPNYELPRLHLDASELHKDMVEQLGAETAHEYTTRSEPWLPALLRLWSEGAEGLVLDAGCGVSLTLDRSDLRALAVAFAVEWFLSPSELCVVMNQGRVFYKDSGSGERLAYTFTSRASAKSDLAYLLEETPGLTVAPVEAALLLEGTLNAGVDRLIVDAGRPRAHALSAANLKALRDLRLGCDPGDAVATTDSFLCADQVKAPIPQETAGGGESPLDLEGKTSPAELLELDPEASDFLSAIVPTTEEINASKAPSRRVDHEVPTEFAPRRSARDAHSRLLEIRELAEANADQAWRATECYANDLDLWVPHESHGSDEELWPSTETHESAEGQQVVRVCVYTSEEEGQRSLSRKSQPFLLRPMLGIEAFRWIWSAPASPVEIAIDPYGEEGGVKLNRNSIPSMLFPATLGIEDLARIREFPFEKLGGLDWAHGLKPEVIRSLALNWRDLLGPPLTGAQSEVEYAGKRYLPVFSEEEHFREFVRSSKTKISRPLRPITNPPFMNWLRLSGRCSGLVLNPPADGAYNGKTLTLDAVELFHLQLWAKLSDQPDGWQVVDALAKLQRGDYSAEQRICGRIAADWPFYLAGKLHSDDGYELIKVPQTDELALFTGERELAEFKRSYRSQDPSIDEAESHVMLPLWRSNFFTLANQKYSGVCINPGSSSEPNGVQLDGKGLDGAMERLEQRLRPRVPGF